MIAGDVRTKLGEVNAAQGNPRATSAFADSHPPRSAALPSAPSFDHGVLSLSGDGTPEAMRLLAAAEADRVAAVERVEARFPGSDLGSMGHRAGVESPRLLQDLEVDADTAGAVSMVDDFLVVGDLWTPRAGLSNLDGRLDDLPDELMVRTPEGQARILEPYIARAALESGRTVVLNTLDRRLGWRLHDLLEDLAVALRCDVQVNAYISRGLGEGFGRHWDSHDVLVTQLVGRKYWEIHQPAQVAPMRGVVADNSIGDVVWSGILEPGSALMIPRGWAHRVTGFAHETSVHLTYSVRRPALVELVSLLDSDRFAAAVRSLALDDLEHAVAQWRSRLVSLPREGPISTGALLDRRFAGARLRARLVGGAVFVPDRCTADELVLVANRREVIVPRTRAHALAWLLENPGSTVDEMSAAVGVESPDLAEMLTTWGRAGLLHVLPEP